jgi:hypothetical protein
MDNGELIKATFFQIIKFPIDSIETFIKFFESEKIMYRKLIQKGNDTYLFVEAGETLGFKLRKFKNYSFYTFYMENMTNLLRNLVSEGYSLKDIDLPRFFEDSETEDSIFRNLYENNYDEVISLMKNSNIMINKFSINKNGNLIVIYRSGAFYIDEKTKILDEFVEILRHTL